MNIYSFKVPHIFLVRDRPRRPPGVRDQETKIQRRVDLLLVVQLVDSKLT